MNVVEGGDAHAAGQDDTTFILHVALVKSNAHDHSLRSFCWLTRQSASHSLSAGAQGASRPRTGPSPPGQSRVVRTSYRTSFARRQRTTGSIKEARRARPSPAGPS